MSSKGTYSYRHIWAVAYPILISLVMEQMIGLTDTAFLGRVGEVELGASAIAIVYYMVLFMIGFGFSIGTQIIIGRRNGEGNYRDTGKVFWHGLYFLLGLSGVLIVASELFSPWLMDLIVSSDDINKAALSYVRWRHGVRLCDCNVQGILCWHHTDQDTNPERHSDGSVQRILQLGAYLRTFRMPSTGHHRSCHWFEPCRTCVAHILHNLHTHQLRQAEIRA